MRVRSLLVPTIPPKKSNDPEIPFTASFAAALLQRLERIEMSVRFVKVFLAFQVSGHDVSVAVSLFAAWQQMEDEASSSTRDELQWMEKVFRNLSQRSSADPDA